MKIFGAVGMKVMLTMMSGPPERSFLESKAADERTNKLKPSGSLEGSMGEVAVIEGRQS
jgi:hypothetical protein